MGFSVGVIFQAVLLCLNAMAILSERRLLAKYGLASPAATSYYPTSGENAFGSSDELMDVDRRSSMVSNLAMFLSSVRTLMRWPLIFMNTAVIIFTLLFG
uniref:Yos1-like protein n=1 Tax=Trypanosoma congolense (strain IL3000) TaxID=1068625 RepID=G0UUU2_TRYCI|nr:conserved hypothetical protein [Trypanosoma congolense IL3000]